MEYTNIIAIISGFEPMEQGETGRVLVTEDMDWVNELETDTTTKIPTTHRSSLDWLDDPEEYETPIGVLIR